MGIGFSQKTYEKIACEEMSVCKIGKPAHGGNSGKIGMMFPGTDVNIDVWVLLEEMFSKVLYMRCNSFNLCIHLEVAEPFL
jgi:hypothetical protein